MNAILGYVPGEVIIRRLLALLDDTSTMFQSDASSQGTLGRANQTNGHGASLPPAPVTPSRHVFNQMPDKSVYTKIAGAARRLAKVSFWGSGSGVKMSNYGARFRFAESNFRQSHQIL